jgi:hypothetical protein
LFDKAFNWSPICTDGALDLAGESVGRFGGGPATLSIDRCHLDGFGD